MNTTVDMSEIRPQGRRTWRFVLTVVLVLLALFLLCVPGRTGITGDAPSPVSSPE